MTTIDIPIPNDSLTNKQATQKNSLYHTCRYVLQALSTIQPLQPYLTISDATTIVTPMSKLWHFCRQGTSLCILFNTLRPEHPISLEQQNPSSSSTTAQKPKAYVYHFIIACRDQLHFTSDTLFTLKDVFQDDTNGFVKVVNVLKRVVEMLKSEGIIFLPTISNIDSDTNTSPKDTRDKIVIELLETERKYVQDLETLQNYMLEAQNQEVLPPDTLYQLFGNLNAMVDCQRRFLVQVEEQADGAPQDQRFGLLFLQHEETFSVYEPFCANFQTAQSLVLREIHALEQLAHVLSPSFELPSILIKPVQRICKYPLLMKQLVKSTPSHWPFFDETKQGLEAIQRVAAKVNETKRRQENLITVQDLKNRVEDWPPSDIDDFGPLLLHDKFMVYRGDPGRELIVYLFEKCLFVCREEKDKEGKDGNHKKSQKKNKKKDQQGNGNASTSATTTTTSDAISGPNTTSERLGVRGRILMSRVAQVNDTSQDGNWSLCIFWSEKYLQPGQQFRLDSFTLKCRHQEQLQLWESSLNRLIKQMKQQAREAKQSAAAAAAAAQATATATATTAMSSPSSPQYLALPTTPGSHMLSRLDSSILDSHDDDDEEEEDDDQERHMDDLDHEHRLPPSSRQNFYDATVHGMTLPPLPRPTISPPTSYPSSPTTRMASSSNSSRYPTTKVKVHHLGSIYVLIVPLTIDYKELVERIERKMRCDSSTISTSALTLTGLKYQDEDGDLITIGSNDDLQMGFEQRGLNNTVNLYIV
ncbi:uncharacterized protein BX664DRAFT_271545 [Halteromyces radiatus]|uniref:uncharacterized protein n=1 Tax=Halteromyces radiatus TaxID=101107 RepID=UPI00222108F0|nr:uncharacterized protein BX664DRAFT_271545 [Halteromyces radiatus]KAI8098750.1 hypothetical protein BX664DRAFT_271545 [Halteromyces radiatus]